MTGRRRSPRDIRSCPPRPSGLARLRGAASDARGGPANQAKPGRERVTKLARRVDIFANALVPEQARDQEKREQTGRLRRRRKIFEIDARAWKNSSPVATHDPSVDEQPAVVGILKEYDWRLAE